MSWRQRRVAQAVFDLLCWLVAFPIALMLRLDFEYTSDQWRSSQLIGLLAGVIFVALSTSRRLYSGRYLVGSFDEVVSVVANSGVVVAVFFLVSISGVGTDLPRSLVILGGGISVSLMLAYRFVIRGIRQRVSRERPGRRTLIFGAGEAGVQLAKLLLSEKNPTHKPIGFIDDDEKKRHFRSHGIRVLGTREDLERLTMETRAETVLVAVANANGDLLSAIDVACEKSGAQLFAIPTISQIASGTMRISDFYKVREEDLLGRQPIATDESGIGDLFRNRTILVTGGGGSIGSEIVRQLLPYEPARLLVLDRDESALLEVQLSLDGDGTLSSDELILADIRDAVAIEAIFAKERPEIVFHAAALKHLTLLENFPEEAWKTNVLGTKNVLDSALNFNVRTFVNVSTDKAANPTSVLGRSKLLTERMTATAATEGARFLSVRFGNVLGSRGSVLQIFRKQIDAGGPVTLTDPEVTRFFMTIPEAVHLVLQAATIGNAGETLILDMGEPVRIMDVANHMIRKSGKRIRIKVTGLRPGEKIEEVLANEDERVTQRVHPRISHTRAKPLADASDLASVDIGDFRKSMFDPGS